MKGLVTWNTHVQYESPKGLVTWNTHVQYESPISSGSKVIAKVKVFQK